MAHSEFTLLGDAVWLDFINSSRGRTFSPPDLLPDAEAYNRWSRVLHLDPDDGASFSLVRAFREQLTTVAEALHAGMQPPGSAIAAINSQLARCAGSHQLTRIGGGWRLRFAPSRSLRAIEAIARSAAATLADPTTLVRRCAGETCSLFFADDSPTQGRRWCDPMLCGQAGRVERRRGSLR